MPGSHSDASVRFVIISRAGPCGTAAIWRAIKTMRVFISPDFRDLLPELRKDELQQLE